MGAKSAGRGKRDGPQLETTLQAKEKESLEAGAIQRNNADHSWETKRHEDEKTELVTRARQLLAELNRTKYDLDTYEKRRSSRR